MQPRRILAFVLLLAAAASARAQEGAEDPAPAPEGTLRARASAMLKEALRDRRAHAHLAELIAAAPKRLAGSPGAEAAVAWGASAMRRVGLDAVRLEGITVPRWVRGSGCSVVIHADLDVAEVPLAALALGGSTGTPREGVTGEVVEVLSFGQLRALGDAARGKIVLFNRPFDVTVLNTGRGYGGAVDQRVRGAVEAAKAGAVAALVRSVTSEPDDVPHTGNLRYEDGVPEIPAAALGVLSAERLSGRLRSGPVRVTIRQDCAMLDPVPSANVVGEIRGREAPDEVVLAGAHLDAWDVGEGAHDDGAGCAHVLEAARLILATGPAPRRTIRFVLFMNEENGLAGGEGYAERHRDALGRHVLAIESDSGGFAPQGFTVGGGRPVLDALAPVAAALAALDLGTVKDGHGGADISTLEPAGVPLMALKVAGERYFDLHHTAKDVLAAVHPRELAAGAAALAIMAFGAADLPGPLPRAKVKDG